MALWAKQPSEQQDGDAGDQAEGLGFDEPEVKEGQSERGEQEVHFPRDGLAYEHPPPPAGTMRNQTYAGKNRP